MPVSVPGAVSGSEVLPDAVPVVVSAAESLVVSLLLVSVTLLDAALLVVLTVSLSANTAGTIAAHMASAQITLTMRLALFFMQVSSFK